MYWLQEEEEESILAGYQVWQEVAAARVTWSIKVQEGFSDIICLDGDLLDSQMTCCSLLVVSGFRFIFWHSPDFRVKAVCVN